MQKPQTEADTDKSTGEEKRVVEEPGEDWTLSPEGKKSKRGRVGEGRPTKRTPEVVAKIAEAVAIGLTDEEAALLAGINPDTMTEWRKDPEFSGATKRATAQRLKLRLERIEAGETGWQGTAWALERQHPARFARPEVLNARLVRITSIEGKSGEWVKLYAVGKGSEIILEGTHLLVAADAILTHRILAWSWPALKQRTVVM
jgi:hypothetical protein